MLYLYQVGHVPLYNILQASENAVELDTGRTWRNPTSVLTGISGDVSNLALGRSLLNNKEVTIKGDIIEGYPYPKEQVLNELMSLGGHKNVPIIVFDYRQSDVKDSSPCRCDDISIQWYVAYGTITSVDRKAVWVGKSGEDSHHMIPITITMSFSAIWEVLNEDYWEYRLPTDRLTSPFAYTQQRSQATKTFEHPATLRRIRTGGYFFKWSDDLSINNPTYWGEKHKNKLTGVGTSFIRQGVFNVYAPELRFSAPPLSYYAFTNFSNPSQGSLYIDVRRNLGNYHTKKLDTVSSLDILTLNTDLNNLGFDKLYQSDIIIAGSVNDLPSIVIREGRVLANAKPRWSYYGGFVGECGAGYNQIRIYSTGTNAEIAFLHDFRTL